MVAARLRGVRRRALGVALVALIGASAATAVRADEHDPELAGHPLRIIAYALHPIGVAIDYLIMRPAHWVVNREPFRTIFGHED